MTTDLRDLVNYVLETELDSFYEYLEEQYGEADDDNKDEVEASRKEELANGDHPYAVAWRLEEKLDEFDTTARFLLSEAKPLNEKKGAALQEQFQETEQSQGV